MRNHSRIAWSAAAAFVALPACTGPSGTALRSLKTAADTPEEFVNAAPTFFLSNDPAHLLRGDGTQSHMEPRSSTLAGMSRYAPGDCGVHTSMLASPSVGSGIALLRGDLRSGNRCPGEARAIRITLALVDNDGSVTSYKFETVPLILNVLRVQPPVNKEGFDTPVDSAVLRSVELSDVNGFCGKIHFSPVLDDGTITHADPMLVTRISADTWLFQNRPDDIDPVSLRVVHRDKVWCESDERLYHMPTMFVIRSRVSEPARSVSTVRAE